jgi:hypothetical protein
MSIIFGLCNEDMLFDVLSWVAGAVGIWIGCTNVGGGASVVKPKLGVVSSASKARCRGTVVGGAIFWNPKLGEAGKDHPERKAG